MPQKSEVAVIAQTVLLEAEGEPFEGKLAVAYSIINRMRTRNLTATEICWQPWQYSCWQLNLGQIAKRGVKAPVDEWHDSWEAAESAFYGRRPDPTNGATHYLNIELTRKIRGDGSLPSWVAAMHHSVKIGQHDFYLEKP